MSEKTEKIIEISRSLLGTPYKYGAKMEEAPDYFDCSGFTKYVFAEIGIDIPRSTIEQAAEGEEVDEAQIQAGDLIFVRGSRGHYNPRFPQGIGHVGIATGEGTVIHAATQRLSEKPIIEKGQVVESSYDEYKNAWQPIVAIKRFIL